MTNGRNKSVGPAFLPGRLVLAVGLVLALAPAGRASQEKPAGPDSATKTTGWVCGLVVDEVHSFVAEAELALFPVTEPSAPEPEPVARVTTDAHGTFCLQDITPGFYNLRASKTSWPLQPLRKVEVRAGLMNRLSTPIELELEPGEPRVSFSESFDGMSTTEARGVLERLLRQGDAASIQELARRLLPKRGPRFELNRLVLGLDVKPLEDELIRQLESGYLPPLKTARYLYVVGELADARTRDAAIGLLLNKLRDARRLPLSPYTIVGETGETAYVSDEAIHALVRLAGKDFDWKYGKSPLQNQRAIRAAQTWWKNELQRNDSRR